MSGQFFTAWNGRDPAALGQLFSPADSLLDMATQHQDTVTGHTWASSTGPAEIIAFARQQWRHGERLEHRGVSTVTNGGLAGNTATPS